MDHLDLLLHPVRLRIVHTLSGDRALTTAQICAALPDSPRTSVYRHVAALSDGGILEVAEERRVRGAVERRFRLRRDRAEVTEGDSAAMSLDDHRRGFAAALAALHAEFLAYLDRDGADPLADEAGYRQGVVWLDDDERRAVLQELRDVLVPRFANGPTPGRSPRLVSLIQFPAADTPEPDA